MTLLSHKLNLSQVKRVLIKHTSYAWIILFGIAVAATLYLLRSSYLYGLGYPLDDAWIHQTYARNLTILGEWSFVPGFPSGGSTSPLWTLLLSIGYLIKLPMAWTYFLGLLFLYLSAILVVQLFSPKSHEISSQKAIFIGLFIALEWHLLWAALSGMETIFYIFIIVAFFRIIQKPEIMWFGGLLAAIAVWIRPDGVLLLGPWMWVILFSSQSKQQKLIALVKGLVGCFILLAGYLGFNHLISGSWLPNTFYAKQMEYAVLIELPLYKRVFNLFVLPWIGPAILLLPGLVTKIIKIIQKRDYFSSAALLWALGYMSVYAFQLPVTYQHGRYIMPVMPILYMLSFAGFWDIIQELNIKLLPWRVLKDAWKLSFGLVLIGFTVLGSSSYAKDVAIINSEMVNVANWISNNTTPNAIIAAHDIGALGYYGNRKIIDLAGLINPEVVPFLRNEAALSAYMDKLHVNYLVIFPSWYPLLAERATPVYDSNGQFVLDAGGENMIVYKWFE